MVQVSASYNYCNPNFIIQNIDEPKTWAHPIFAVLKNIFMRGCPTIPSLYLRDIFGEPEDEKVFKYSRDFSNLNWTGIIKGGNQSNPALDFYYNTLLKHFALGGSFIPEYPVSKIFNNLDWFDRAEKLGQVDFYSPIYNTVIEIDGVQHNYGGQRAKDTFRDELFARNNVKLIRIPTSILNDDQKVKELLDGVFEGNGKKLRYLREEQPIGKKYIPYSFAIRLQTLLLYLYGTGRICLDAHFLKLNIAADVDITKEQIQAIINDFYLWVENLAALQNLQFSRPHVDIILCDESNTLFQLNGIKIDLSLTKVYCKAPTNDIYYVRNDFFEYSTHSQIRNEHGIVNLLGKNYFQVAYSPIEYNLNENTHADNLRYVLRNLSIIEYQDFRTNQLEIIIEALNNRCVIGVLPTGAGKSLCYQIAALLIPSMTVVISPLKILMVDQFEHLRDKLGINHATFINSTHTEQIELFRKGKSLITLVAPERFFNERFLGAFNDRRLNLKIGFIVIDEAHCLSEWGHDFRTSYLCLSHNLGRLLPQDTFLMALTGTASHSVFRDIENEFYYFKHKHTKSIFASDMRRSNLQIHVQMFSNEDNHEEKHEKNDEDERTIFQELKDNLLPTIVGENKKKTIVFTKTKRGRMNDETASACISLSYYFDYLGKKYGRKNVVNFFSGGNDLEEAERDSILADFKNDTTLRIIFATKAFGMGIDIKDIRKTIHYGLPSSMESLYQQIGRAGRDGKHSDCYIYFKKERKEDYDFFFSSAGIKINEIARNMNRLVELGTNFYFIQNANLDVSIEKLVVKYIYEGICLKNEKGEDFSDCQTICDALLKNIKDKHLISVLGKDEKIEKYVDGKILTKWEFVISTNASIIIERALYRLFLLGEIEMWNVVYESNISNPIFTHLKKTDYSDEYKYQRLTNHIERYESRAKMPKKKDFESRLEKLLQWSYDNFVIERIKSMKTLYDWCSAFTDSANFMKQLAEYFSNDPVYVRLIDNNASAVDWILAIKRHPKETKLRIARLLESYEKIDALNYVSGITRLRLGEFNEFDGERRLDMSFEGVKQMSEGTRLQLFVETYEVLEEPEMKNALVSKWLRYIPKDARWIYDNTKNEQAEQYLLTSFIDELLKIKEKIDAKLR